MTSTAAMAPYWSGEATAPEVTAPSDACVWLDGGGAGGGCGGLEATSPRSDRAAAADRIRWPLCIGYPPPRPVGLRPATDRAAAAPSSKTPGSAAIPAAG